MFFIFVFLNLISSAASNLRQPENSTQMAGNPSLYPVGYAGDSNQAMNFYNKTKINGQTVTYPICNVCGSNQLWNLNTTRPINDQTITWLECFHCGNKQTWVPNSNLGSESVQQRVFTDNNQSYINSRCYLNNNLNPECISNISYANNNQLGKISSATTPTQTFAANSQNFFKPGPTPDFFYSMGDANNKDYVTQNTYKGMYEFIKLDWNDIINDISKAAENHSHFFENHKQYIDNKLNELVPLQKGINLDSNKWINLNFYEPNIDKQCYNVFNNSAFIYTGELPLNNYIIYKKLDGTRSKFLIAHKSARFSLSFNWNDMVVLMDNTVVNHSVYIGQKSIIGPYSIIDSYSSIFEENIFLERVTVNKYIKIEEKNIFFGNIVIGDSEIFAKDDCKQGIKTKAVIITDSLKNSGEAFIYLKEKQLQVEIGAKNLFLNGVKIGKFTRILKNNIFHVSSYISDHVFIKSECYFGKSSSVGFNTMIENKTQIQNFYSIEQCSVYSKPPVTENAGLQKSA